MGRRNRTLMSESDSSSDTDASDSEMQRKRRRNTKESDVYGVFAEEDEEESRPRRSGTRSGKVPSFVQSHAGLSAGLKGETQGEGQEEEGKGGEDDEGRQGKEGEGEGEGWERKAGGRPGPGITRSSDGDEEATDARDSPEIHIDADSSEDRSDEDVEVPGLNYAQDESDVSSSSDDDDEPPRKQSFVTRTSFTKPAAPKQLSKKEQQHFAKLATSGSIGVKLLAKMGWSAGRGLGRDGEGIVTPIGEGQNVRKGRAGIATGERIRTEEEKQEERIALAKAKQEKKEKIWKTKKPAVQSKKTKVAFKTYDELVEEQSIAPQAPELVTDLSGRRVDKVSNYGTVGTSFETTRLPELRHNLNLLASTASHDLHTLAREGHDLKARREFIEAEEIRLEKAKLQKSAQVDQLRLIAGIVEQVRSLQKSVATEADLSVFDDIFSTVEDLPFKQEEIIVAAVAETFKRLFATWQPLVHPTLCVPFLTRWRKLLLPTKTKKKERTIFDRVESDDENEEHASMSPYEVLLWTLWLPKIRNAVNNDWDASDPQPLINVYAGWEPLLPQFLKDNVLDQLVMPKLLRCVEEYSLKEVYTIVVLWMPYLGHRIGQLTEQVKLRLSLLLRKNKIEDVSIQQVAPWKNVFDEKEWNSILLKYVLPRLADRFKKFVINPRQQNNAPLEDVMAWKDVMTRKMLDQLLGEYFFPPFLDALYSWLTHTPDMEQVAQWYKYWRGYFTQDVLDYKSSILGFKEAVELMNESYALGTDQKNKLHKPVAVFEEKLKTKKPRKETMGVVDADAEIPLIEILEHEMVNYNLLILSTTRIHGGNKLYRVSSNVDGSGGVDIYLDMDICWMKVGDEYEPCSIAEIVQKVNVTL